MLLEFLREHSIGSLIQYANEVGLLHDSGQGHGVPAVYRGIYTREDRLWICPCTHPTRRKAAQCARRRGIALGTTSGALH